MSTAEFVVMPDATKLVADFLRADTDVAALVGTRVYSIIPAERTYPLVLAAQVADVPMTTQPWWATRAVFRLSAYDLTANGARHLMEVVRAVLAQRAIGRHALGTVAWVSFANFAFLPDDAALTPGGRPMPRWSTLCTVTVHPNP